MTQVFISHTKKDEKFCDEFDRVCARVGIESFRSEFEEIPKPAWKKIKEVINNSVALFFLVGKELVESQDLNDPEWRHTQNWIAYEMGLACQLGIDVWAIRDGPSINFPMPYINNYLFNVGLSNKVVFDYLRSILKNYKEGVTFPLNKIINDKNVGVSCPYPDCKMGFNLHVRIKPGGNVTCPQCLRNIVFPQGHLEDI